MGEETQRQARAKLVLTRQLFSVVRLLWLHTSHSLSISATCGHSPSSHSHRDTCVEGQPNPSPDHLPGIVEPETTPSEGPRRMGLGSAIFGLHKYRRSSVFPFCKVGIMTALSQGCGDAVHWWPAEEVPVCLWVEMLQLISCPIAEA